MKNILILMAVLFSAFSANAAITTTHFTVRLTVLDTCTTTNGKVACMGGTATNTQKGYDGISQETKGNLVTITY